MRASATSSDLLQQRSPSLEAAAARAAPRRLARGNGCWLALGVVQAATTAIAVAELGLGPGLVLSSFLVGLPATGFLWLGRERSSR
jgi:hypothetical protein